MKTNDLLLLGLLGFGAYSLFRKGNTDKVTGTQDGSIPAGFTTPTGVVVQPPITSTAEGVEYINKNILQKTSVTTAKSGLPSPVTSRQTVSGNKTLTTGAITGKVVAVKVGKVNYPTYIARAKGLI